MRRALLALALVGCASVPPPRPAPLPRLLPPATDVYALLPPAPPPVDLSSLPDGDDVAVDEGQCPGLPTGILVSERSYAAAINDRAKAGRLGAELAALRALREREREAVRAAEVVYLERLRGLEEEAAKASRRSLWERAAPWVALAGGVLFGSVLFGR